MMFDFFSVIEAFGIEAVGMPADPQRCPVCNAQSLRAFSDDSISCSSCRFSGGVIDFAAAALQLSTRRALKLFENDGEFRKLLTDPDAQLKEYHTRRHSQAYIEKELDAAGRLLRGPERIPVCRRLIECGVTCGYMHADLVAPDRLPWHLVDGEGPVACVFRFSGAVMGVRAFAPGAADRPDIGPDDPCVFPEHSASDPCTDTVYITRTPQLAHYLVSVGMHYSSVRQPIICATGFPLPPAYAGCGKVVLIDAPGAELTPEDALRWSAMAHVQRAVSGACGIFVATLPSNMPAVDDLPRCVCHAARLSTWTGTRLTALFVQNGPGSVAAAASGIRLGDNIIRPIANAMVTRGASPEAIDELKVASRGNACRIDVRAGDKRFAMFRDRLMAVSLKDGRMLRSVTNFGMTINELLLSPEGGCHVRVRVVASDGRATSLTLYKTVLERFYLFRMRVAHAFAADGIYFNPECSEMQAWPGIVNTLAQSAPVHNAVTHITVRDGALELPRLSIRAESVRPQTRLANEKRDFRHYDGLASEGDDRSGATLAAMIGSPASARTCAIGAMAVLMARNVTMCARAGKPVPGPHLMIAGLDTKTADVMVVLAKALSGRADADVHAIPQLTHYLARAAPLKGIEALGCMPVYAVSCKADTKPLTAAIAQTHLATSSQSFIFNAHPCIASAYVKHERVIKCVIADKSSDKAVADFYEMTARILPAGLPKILRAAMRIARDAMPAESLGDAYADFHAYRARLCEELEVPCNGYRETWFGRQAHVTRQGRKVGTIVPRKRPKRRFYDIRMRNRAQQGG